MRQGDYGGLSSLFQLQWIVAPHPGGDGPRLGGLARLLQLPNLAFYPLSLLGLDGFVSLPGIGALGLFALIRFTRRSGPFVIFGWCSLVVLATTLGTYLVYPYQSGRFLMGPAALNNIAAAVFIIIHSRQVMPAWVKMGAPWHFPLAIARQISSCRCAARRQCGCPRPSSAGPSYC